MNFFSVTLYNNYIYIFFFQERLTSLEKVPKVNASAVNDEKSNSDLQKLTLLVNKLNENVTYLNNSLTNEIELLQNKPFQDPVR